jgi:predicted nuclease of restriction endonuclease-like (RecB) superfamily
MKFEHLITLFQDTHNDLQGKAAHSVDVALVVRNWLFGWYIVEYEQQGEDRAKYGVKLINQLAEKLKIRGCSPTNLRKFREFYQAYPEIQQTVSVESQQLPDERIGTSVIRQTVSAKLVNHFSLGWSHYVALMTVDNVKERRFYEIESVQNSWSVRDLKRQMKASLYERLALSRDKAAVKALSEQGHVVGEPKDIIKNPYVLEFLNLEAHSSYSEHDLETAIIDKLEHFLLEMGKGFLFEARQKRFTFDDDHFYVDLVFYNRLLRCYVLIDLKRDKLTHQDLGQMQMYVNYFDRYVKTEDENPTVGILLCHRKNDALVELTLPDDANIYASKYQLYLPDKEELRQQLIQWSQESEEQSNA